MFAPKQYVLPQLDGLSDQERSLSVPGPPEIQIAMLP